jgi:hypothetical protein
MAKAFQGTYLSGHPALRKQGRAVLKVRRKGIEVTVPGFRTRRVLIPWEDVRGSSVSSRETSETSGGGLSATGGLLLISGSLWGGLLQKRVRTIVKRIDTLSVAVVLKSGVATNLQFESRHAHDAHTLIVAHVPTPRPLAPSQAAQAQAQPAWPSTPVHSGTAAAPPYAVKVRQPTRAIEPSRETSALAFVLGWLFVPFLMAPAYVIKNWEDIRSGADPTKRIIAGVGAGWALLVVILAQML